MNTSYQHHDISREDFDIKKVISDIKNDGLVVIDNIYTKQECDQIMDETLNVFEKLGTNVDRNKINKTWKNEMLPCQSKFGMFHSVMGHMPSVWKVRKNEKIENIFRAIYQNVRGLEEKEKMPMVVSIDGINIQPKSLGPVYKGPEDHFSRDWAHMDQSTYNEVYKCIQGSMTLTNTTHCFRVSPKSHKVYEKILAANNIKAEPVNTSMWCQLPQEIYPEIKEMIEGVGGEFQIPVRVKAGSLILWWSTTLHSAMSKLHLRKKSQESQDETENNLKSNQILFNNEIINLPYTPNSNDFWEGWRGVFYVCFRPLEDFSDEELDKIVEATSKNISMNHWGTWEFTTTSNYNFSTKTIKIAHENIKIYVESPEKFLDVIYTKQGLERPVHPVVELRKNK